MGLRTRTGEHLYAPAQTRPKRAYGDATQVSLAHELLGFLYLAGEPIQPAVTHSEGTDSIIQPCDIGEFIIDPQIPIFEKIRVVPSDLAGPVRIALQRTSSCNIFCLFAVNKPIEGSIFPKSYQWFTTIPLFYSRTPAGVPLQG